MGRIGVCILVAGIFLLLFVQKTNQLNQVRKEIPELQKELKRLSLYNERLQFAIETFESPKNLMQFTRQAQFRHLKFPRNDEVILFSDESE